MLYIQRYKATWSAFNIYLMQLSFMETEPGYCKEAISCFCGW